MPDENTSPAAPETPTADKPAEKLLSQSEVNKIVERVRQQERRRYESQLAAVAEHAATATAARLQAKTDAEFAALVADAGLDMVDVERRRRLARTPTAADEFSKVLRENARSRAARRRLDDER
jgi:hypothetical protein